MSGSSHVNDNKLNQDFVISGNNRRLYAAALADGVTSCSEARTGAEIACNMLMKIFLRKGDFLLRSKTEHDMKKSSELIISHVSRALHERALNDSINIEEYSCTLAGVLADTKAKKMLYFSIGDSIVIAIPKNGSRCKILTRPDNNAAGVCVTTTENAELMSKINVINTQEFSSVIIFSDGAWHEIFDKNILKKEVSEILISHNYKRLKEFLNSRKIFDDYSFIALNLSEITGKEKST